MVLHSLSRWCWLLLFQTSPRPTRHSKFSVKLTFLYLAAFLVLLSTSLHFVLKETKKQISLLHALDLHCCVRIVKGSGRARVPGDCKEKKKLFKYAWKLLELMISHQTLYTCTLSGGAFSCMVATVLVSVVITVLKQLKLQIDWSSRKVKKSLVWCQQPLIVELWMFQIQSHNFHKQLSCIFSYF